jgi:hypothetical protein
VEGTSEHFVTGTTNTKHLLTMGLRAIPITVGGSDNKYCVREAIKIKIRSNLGHSPDFHGTQPLPPYVGLQNEKNDNFVNAVLNDSEYSEYAVSRLAQI